MAFVLRAARLVHSSLSLCLFPCLDFYQTALGVPIVPIGLTYSDASGERFRGSVLVDIGKPIHITPDLLELHRSGVQGSKQACEDITDTMDEREASLTAL